MRHRTNALVEPLQIVPATPPVEATLRILMNSVPYLIGCAVVRQPARPDAVAAEVGRNPWLFDRRLTTLQLPDDTLPPNRAVALDWPVPYQAEWVGVPPRLLISRLVFSGRTVGVLLGTLITREPMNAQTREAIDLSCELIASAMAMDAAATLALPAAEQEPATFEYAPPPAIAEVRPEPFHARPALVAAPPAPAYVSPVSSGAPIAASDAPPVAPGLAAHIQGIASQIGAAVAGASDARAIGRILRDAMNEVSEASAFSVALFHLDRPEVAYRYKVVGVDAASSELGKQAVDDSPSCFAVRNAERWHAFDRAITVAAERRRIGVVQIPLASGQDAIGVVTLQTFREGGFASGELALIAAIVDATVGGFAAARAAGRFQPSAAAVTAAVPAATPEPELPGSTDDILRLLLEQLGTRGMPTSFIVGLDPEAGMLRGDRVSTSSEAGGIDRLIGISDARFAVSVDDRYNAIARACREARTLTAPTVHELLQPVHDWNEAALVERLTGGGRSAIAPIVVNGDVVGAVIAGPRAEEFSHADLDGLTTIVGTASARLAAAWREATLGTTAVNMPAEALQQARDNVA
jgi:hypothetical protein